MLVYGCVTGCNFLLSSALSGKNGYRVMELDDIMGIIGFTAEKPSTIVFEVQ